MLIFVPHEHFTKEEAVLGIVMLLPHLGQRTFREGFPDDFPPLTFSNSSMFIFFIWLPPGITTPSFALHAIK